VIFYRISQTSNNFRRFLVFTQPWSVTPILSESAFAAKTGHESRWFFRNIQAWSFVVQLCQKLVKIANTRGCNAPCNEGSFELGCFQF
jgi:hypothetical protein